jgi:hypothetical protein
MAISKPADWEEIQQIDWEKLLPALPKSADRIPSNLASTWTEGILRPYVLGYIFSASTSGFPDIEHLDLLSAKLPEWKERYGAEAANEGDRVVARMLMGWLLLDMLNENQNLVVAVTALKNYNWGSIGPEVTDWPVGFLHALGVMKNIGSNPKMVADLKAHVQGVLNLVRPGATRKPDIAPTSSPSGIGCASVVLAIVSLGLFSLLLCLR